MQVQQGVITLLSTRCSLPRLPNRLFVGVHRRSRPRNLELKADITIGKMRTGRLYRPSANLCVVDRCAGG